MAEVLTGITKFISSVFGFTFSKKLYPFSISVIILIILLFPIVKQSIQERTPMPFLIESGKIIIGSDKELYDNVKFYKEKESQLGSIEKFKAWLSIIGSVWFLFLIFKTVYMIWSKRDTSKALGNIFFTFLTLTVLQIIYFSIITGSFYPPWQGLWSFITNSGMVIEPVSNIGGISLR